MRLPLPDGQPWILKKIEEKANWQHRAKRKLFRFFLLSSAGRKHFLGWRNKIIYQVFFCGCIFIAFFYVTGENWLFIFPLSWPWIRKMIFCLITRTHTFQLLFFLALEEETPRNNLSVLCFKKRENGEAPLIFRFLRG